MGRVTKSGGGVSVLPLYLGFLGSGIGVALPGAILPVLLTRWGLQDQGGGNLFFLAFAGSSLGALLISGSLVGAIALGAAAVAVAGVAMSVTPAGLAFPCMFLFGLGLGMTMTAVSLLLQRRTGGASQAMVRLNLVWALGASLCPVLALRTLRTAEPGALLLPLALGFALLAGWALRGKWTAGEEGDPSIDGVLRRVFPGTGGRGSVAGFFRATPASLILLVMLATGVEAAAGGWLATYAKRGGDAFAGVIGAPTCLWVGLLLSRFFWSLTARVRERPVLQGSMALMAASTLTLLAGQHGWAFFAAALCLGLGSGPIYPLLLAKALRFHASGTIFFLAGTGSALLPWLMGFVSTQSRSLHTGFYVPATGCVVMVLLSALLPGDTVDG